MSDVNWLALWAEFAQAMDNEQLEVAEQAGFRRVYRGGLAAEARHRRRR
jgi:hypothetical protein